MSVTAIELYNKTRRYLRDFRGIDSLTGSMTSGSGTASVLDSTIYQVRWPIEIDQETMIISNIPNGTTLSLLRGAYGSTTQAHSSGALIQVRPNFYGIEILDALNEGIQACYPRIYKRVIDTSLTILSNTYEYTVPNMPGTYSGDTIQIPRIYQVELQTATGIPYSRATKWDVVRGVQGGHKLKFQNLEVPGANIRISGHGPFPDLSDYSAVLDSSFPKQATYILPLYAAASLLMSAEAGRVRQSSGAVDNREQANRVGSSGAIGQALMNRFYLELDRASIGPPGSRIRTRPY